MERVGVGCVVMLCLIVQVELIGAEGCVQRDMYGTGRGRLTFYPNRLGVFAARSQLQPAADAAATSPRRPPRRSSCESASEIVIPDRRLYG